MILCKLACMLAVQGVLCQLPNRPAWAYALGVERDCPAAARVTVAYARESCDKEWYGKPCGGWYENEEWIYSEGTWIALLPN